MHLDVIRGVGDSCLALTSFSIVGIVGHFRYPNAGR